MSVFVDAWSLSRQVLLARKARLYMQNARLLCCCAGVLVAPPPGLVAAPLQRLESTGLKSPCSCWCFYRLGLGVRSGLCVLGLSRQALLVPQH